MHRLIALAGGLLLSAIALAETGNVSFTPPTTYENGSALPAAAITGYEFRCTSVGTTAGISCSPLNLPGSATGGMMTVVVPATGGTLCVEGRTVTAAASSAWAASSGSNCKVFAPINPNPPGGIRVVQLNLTINGAAVAITQVPAYKVTPLGARGGAVVGYVPAGTPCVGDVVFSYRSREYRRVPRAAVAWDGVKPNDNAAAPCAAS